MKTVKQSRLIGMVGLFAVLLVTTAVTSFAMRPRGPVQKYPAPTPFTIDNVTKIDANLIDMFVTNHGSFAYDWTTGDPGLTYPKGTDKQAIFSAGLWMGAKVGGAIRVTVAEYSTEYQPGPMVDGGPNPNTSDPQYRVYKIDNNSGPGDADWDEWPVEDGAPVDINGDPLLIGDQTLWCVYNDAEPTDHTNNSGGTSPLGIEVQQTAFAYNRTGALGNIVFLKFLIINKGSDVLDSSYVAIWSDPDLGGAGDDLVGCDTSLSVGYCYNATNNDNVYGATPPCPGFDFFQGPIIPGSVTDTAYVSGVAYPGFINLPMTSFNKYINGTDPGSPQEAYWYMLGLDASAGGTPYTDPSSGLITTYVMPGNPTTGTGWLDANPSDRRLMLCSGPFTLQPTSMHGDSVIIGITAQEVVTAVIMGQGADRLNSVTIMKYNDAYAQSAFDANFNIPGPPPQPDVYFQARDGYINLIWGTEAVGDVEINDDFDQEFHFEGYNIYQGYSVAGPWKKVATFDITDDHSWVDPATGDTITAPVGAIYMDQFNAASGGVIRELVQSGANTGTVQGFSIDNDAIGGGALVNYRPYYFAVTAYSFEIRHAFPYMLGEDVVGWVSTTLENAPVPIQCIPGGQGLADSLAATHTTGISDGRVTITYIPEFQENVRGHDYRVTFDTTGGSVCWDLEDLDADSFLILGNTNQSGDWDYPILAQHGIMVKVIGPAIGIKSIRETAGAGGTPIVPSDNVAYSLNSTGDWYVSSDQTNNWDRLNWRGRIGIDNWEFRFEDTTGGGGSEYYNWDDDSKWPDRCPFEVWNTGPTSDPTDDKRIQIFTLDDDASGSWSYGDRIYPFETEYPAEPLPAVPVYVWEDDFHIGRIKFNDNSGATTHPAAGTVVVFTTNKPNDISDVFDFQTRLPWQGLAWDLNNVKVVPNPYYGHSNYEMNPYDKVVKFTNLPREVTIRIFNLGGDHVKTLTKNNTSTELIWNLETKYGIPVASGIYIWYLDAPGIGTKVGKTAVFMERETLVTF